MVPHLYIQALDKVRIQQNMFRTNKAIFCRLIASQNGGNFEYFIQNYKFDGEKSNRYHFFLMGFFCDSLYRISFIFLLFHYYFTVYWT